MSRGEFSYITSQHESTSVKIMQHRENKKKHPFFIKKITANSVFWAACISQTIIFFIYFNIDISYLWLNFIGAVVTILLSIIFESLKLFSR